MREMLKEFEEKPKEKDESEDRLEMSLMSRKDRRARKKALFQEQTAGMNKKEKFKYIVYYYKWYFIFAVVAILTVGAFAIAIYKNTRPVSIAVAALNSEDPVSVSSQPLEDFAKANDMVDGYRVIGDTYYNVSLEYELSNTSSTSNATSLALLLKDNYYDVIITDLYGLEYLNYACALFFMDDYFDAEILEKYKNNIYYSSDYADQSNVKAAINAKSTEILMAVGDRDKPLAVDISGTEFAKNMNLGYDEVYICFPGGSSRNKKRAKMLLEYIFGY